MPDEQNGDSETADPARDSSVKPPAIKSAGQQQPLTESTHANAKQEENETAKLEKDIRTGERWIIGLGIATLIVNIVIASIYYGQLKQMRKATEATGIAAAAAQESSRTAKETLTEVQKGGTDTHELAVQAKNQADRTKDLADRAHDQATASKQAADAARRSADTAAAQLELVERPWITFTTEISGPLYWDTAGNVHFGLKGNIRNTGTTPAISFKVGTSVNAFFLDTQEEDTKIQERVCNRIEENVTLYQGGLLFPLEIQPYEIGPLISAEKIKKTALHDAFGAWEK
jgi:hypothetical protein